MLNITGIIGKFLKNSSQREIDRLKSIVEKINSWEAKIKDIPDENFPAKTQEFKSRINKGAKLDDLIPEAFAYVREASKKPCQNDILMSSSWVELYFIKERLLR